MGRWMMAEDLDNHIAELELVKTTDPDNEKPVYRRQGFDGISTFDELDNKLGEELRRCRQKKGLSRADMATLVGLSEQVYGRYERNSSKMTVSRLIHLSEVLGISPLAMLYPTAPQLWGKTEMEAEARIRIMGLLENLPSDTMESVVKLLETVHVLQEKTGSS